MVLFQFIMFRKIIQDINLMKKENTTKIHKPNLNEEKEYNLFFLF
uniref:Uncharacterized protein n=1 Tax=viral metagenome TaxID=1070528 RepID=A0A6C0BUG1_9ZZZZ